MAGMIISVLVCSTEPKDIQEIDYGVPSIIMRLNAGDVIIGCKDGNTLVFERKKPTDLLNTIKADRLFQQCHKMLRVSQYCYLTIIGEMWRTRDNKVKVDGHRETGWNWDSVQGVLLTVQEMGVAVVYANDFESCVKRLARRDRDNVRVKPTRRSEPMEEDEKLLAALPDIGPILAQQILAKCGNAASALDWLSNIYDDYDIKVAGIGSNQKAAIHKILGLKEQEYLTVNLWESE